MKKLMLCLMLLFGPRFALSQPNLPPPTTPLSHAEGRRILGQLYELQSARAEIAAYKEHVRADRDQDERERASFARALELERQAAALAQSERDLHRERADLCERLYKSAIHRPGIGCRVIRVLTLGIHRCN